MDITKSNQNQVQNQTGEASASVEVKAVIISGPSAEKVKSYSGDGAKKGKYVTQKIQVTSEGPMLGMIISGLKTTLNKEGQVGTPSEVGEEVTAYLRIAIKDGNPVVFADLGGGTTAQATLLAAFGAMQNANQAG